MLAAICNSGMDTLDHHWYVSVFKKFGDQKSFWGDASLTWQRKYSDPQLLVRKKWLFGNYPVSLTDGWHLLKSLMVVFIALSITTYQHIEWYKLIPFPKNYFVNACMTLVVYGCCWNLTFSLFYNKILITKK